MLFDGQVVKAMSEGDRTELRRTAFGFVFQFGQLVPELTAADNLALPLLLNRPRDRRALAYRMGGLALRPGQRRVIGAPGYPAARRQPARRLPGGDRARARGLPRHSADPGPEGGPGQATRKAPSL